MSLWMLRCLWSQRLDVRSGTGLYQQSRLPIWFSVLMERYFQACYFNCGSCFQLSMCKDILPCSEFVLYNVNAIMSRNHIGIYIRRAPHSW